jgi:hypothetical protein
MAIQRDTVLMARIELTGEQHQLQVVDELRKSILQIMALCVAENPADVSAVGQKMQSFPSCTRRAPNCGVTVRFSPQAGTSWGDGM